MIHQVKYRIREEDLILETGRMAKQANGAVLATYGGSTVLSTICCSSSPIEGIDYVPLMVDYNEKHYAAGKIPGGFLKREGRPKDKEILVSRLIDRPLRPLFYKEFGRDLQLIPTTVATDQLNTPDTLGMIGACTAVHISDIPFGGPAAAIRIGVLNGQFIINPTFPEIEEAELEIVVAGTAEGITMVEGGGKEVSEDLMLSAIEKAHATIKDLCELQDDLRKSAGKEKLPLQEKETPLADEASLKEWLRPKLQEACFVRGKHERYAAIGKVKKEFLEEKTSTVPEDETDKLGKVFGDIETEVVRNSILENRIRTDGRGPDEIRPITCEVDVLPRTHGAALFTRGETQALVVTTLGTPYDELRLDNIEGDYRKNFMLHYNFPPYSVGETGRTGTGRREIGHGHLAERSIERVLPSKDDFGYTVRVVSEILESNGSSSMATVCGSTLSLLSAGVPLSKPVAGIAMGLVTDGDRHVVLSDILGEEDHLGDMDFKVSGTKDGITAFQMDIKIAGVDPSIMKTALEKARDGRLYILSIMNETIDRPRSDISQYAPKMITMKVDTEKIGAIIGPGGKNINNISETSQAKVTIEDDGTVQIFAKDGAGAEKAKSMIDAMIEEPEVGKIYQGTVKRIMEFGAFVEFMPGREGLVHISKLSREHVEKVTDVVTEGQELPVRLIEIDRMGRMNLSYVDAQDGDSGDWRPPPRRDGDRGGGRSSRGGRPPRGGGRGGDRGREGRRR